MKKYLLFLYIAPALFSSCKKDLITTNPADKLSFSTDTLTFDTVFTTLGSTTLYFTVRNPNNKKIVVSNIQLAGGDGSVCQGGQGEVIPGASH